MHKAYVAHVVLGMVMPSRPDEKSVSNVELNPQSDATVVKSYHVKSREIFVIFVV